MMRSNSTPEQVELCNARPTHENGHRPHLEDGVWSVDPAAPRNSPVCGRGRNKIIALVALIIIVIIALSIGAGRQRERNSVPTGVSSNQEGLVSTTQSPNAAQTVSSTSSSTTPAPTTSVPSTMQYNCKGERIQNGAKLKTGHYLCAHQSRYRFGMDDTGSLIYADDELNKTANIYNGTKGNYFQLEKDGNFTVYNSTNSVVWQEECSDDVSFYSACLMTHHDQVYDCPYLHLHGHGGTLVLNYVSDDNKWQARNALHVYDLSQCGRHFFCSND